MQSIHYLSFGLVFLLFSISTVMAQTVRVSTDGIGDFISVQAAVDAVEADDSTEPNVVMIAPGTYVNTSVIISQDMAIIGEDADDRPILVLEPAPGDTANDSIITTNGVSVTLENLMLLPSTVFTPDRAVRFDPVLDSDVFTITLSNILISANDGNDQPLSVDGLEPLFPGPDSSVSFNDDGVRILGGPFGGAGNADVTVNVDNTVVTHIDTDRDPSIPTGGLDGFVLGGFNTTINFGPGVVASYCGRYGAQIITTDTTGATVADLSPVLNCNGTADNPIIFKDCGNVGLQLWTGTHDLNYVEFVENPVGLRIDMLSNIVGGEHLLVTGNEDGIAWLNTARNTPTTFDVEDSTLFNNETDLNLATGYTADSGFTPGESVIVFEDSIFAGTFLFLMNSDLTLDLADTVQSQFVMEFTNVAFPDEGAFAVIPEFELFPVTANLQNIVTADPEFLSTDINSPDFVVVSSEAYRTASIDSGPLGGYKLFDGETSILEWTLY